MKLPKNPIWPVQASWKFDGEGGNDGGGGETTPHWAGDAEHQKWASEKGFKDSQSVVKAHRELASRHWAGDDKDQQAYVDKKGVKDAPSLVKMYRELEKKTGTMIGLPAEDANDVDFEKFASKVRGRNIGEYKADLPEGLPEGTYDEGLGEAMKQSAFDVGIPPRMFKQIWGTYWKAVGAQIKELDAKAAEIKAEDEKTMHVKWGKDYDEFNALSDRAQEKMGVKELFEKIGIASHPLVKMAFHQMSEHLEEMKPPDVKGGKGKEESEGSEGEWFTDYSDVEDKKVS